MNGLAELNQPIYVPRKKEKKVDEDISVIMDGNNIFTSGFSSYSRKEIEINNVHRFAFEYYCVLIANISSYYKKYGFQNSERVKLKLGINDISFIVEEKDRVEIKDLPMEDNS